MPLRSLRVDEGLPLLLYPEALVDLHCDAPGMNGSLVDIVYCWGQLVKVSTLGGRWRLGSGCIFATEQDWQILHPGIHFFIVGACRHENCYIGSGSDGRD